jgi:hypothetical protein
VPGDGTTIEPGALAVGLGAATTPPRLGCGVGDELSAALGLAASSGLGLAGSSAVPGTTEVGVLISGTEVAVEGPEIPATWVLLAVVEGREV